MHLNNGKCPQCDLIFNKFSGFYPELQSWFVNLQVQYPEAHISCAGRGKVDQEVLFQRRATLAHYSTSAHNWNAAIDIFVQKPDLYLFDEGWFKRVIGESYDPSWQTWFGIIGSPFYELPHLQVRDWIDLSRSGKLNLVEPI